MVLERTAKCRSPWQGGRHQRTCSGSRFKSSLTSVVRAGFPPHGLPAYHSARELYKTLEFAMHLKCNQIPDFPLTPPFNQNLQPLHGPQSRQMFSFHCLTIGWVIFHHLPPLQSPRLLFPDSQVFPQLCICLYLGNLSQWPTYWSVSSQCFLLPQMLPRSPPKIS